jgi:Arm DNA-binding domain
MQKLTQALVDAQTADGRDRFIFDSQLSGFALRITPTGKRIFVAQSRVSGRKRRITIGYASDMSLSKAREEALQTLAAMRGGVRPHGGAKGAPAGFCGKNNHYWRTGRAVDGRVCCAKA